MAGSAKKKPQIKPGYRIGSLTVTEATSQRKNGYTVWKCLCDCGNEVLLDTRYLQRGTIQDCGCVSKRTVSHKYRDGMLRPGQKDLTGTRFGRLVCISPTTQRGKSGGTIWRCKCDCGNECFAVSTQLTHGYKKSCGCMSHPPIKDYAGRRFGMLTVIEYAGKRDGMHRWRCLCDCGNESIVGQTLLQSGKTKSCGCNGNPPIEDITGKIFGKLTVLGVEKWDKGTSYWTCRCECGNETVVRYGNLISGHTRSCGCLQKEIYKDNLKLVDGTSVAILEANRRRTISTNQSGYTGVHKHSKSGKWVAQITFKKKKYHLGCFDKKEDAVKARLRGEEMYDEFLEWYYSVYTKHSPPGKAE